MNKIKTIMLSIDVYDKLNFLRFKNGWTFGFTISKLLESYDNKLVKKV